MVNLLRYCQSNDEELTERLRHECRPVAQWLVGLEDVERVRLAWEMAADVKVAPPERRMLYATALRNAASGLNRQ